MTQIAPAAAADRFEIVEEDVGGTRRQVFKHAPRSLRAVWDLTAAHGDATYLVFGDEQYSFAETRSMVAALSNHLVGELKVRKGDRVAIAMRNYPEWAVAFWGAALAGAVVVPLNAWWTGPELAYALAHSEAAVLFCDRERRERLRPHLSDLGLPTVVVRGEAAESLPFADLATGADDLPDVQLDPDDIATIMYTSGTTGRPKGAVGTHRNIGAHLMNGQWAAAQAAATGVRATPRPAPSTLLTFPLFHVGGLHAFLIPYAASGGKIVLLYKWDAGTALDLIEREGVTRIGGVPTTLFELLDEARRRGRPPPSLAGVAAGAAPVPPALVRRIDHQLGSRASATNAYGLTETQGVVTVNAGKAYLERPDSVGRPISPVVQVSVVQPDGSDAEPGDIGEIWVRSPTVIREYFRDPEATAAALTDGWFHTGDIGRVDRDGFLYIVDRAKDVIIRGGENVYAVEVEAVLYEHHAIAEAGVVGVPDGRLGEQVAAVIRLRPGCVLTAADVRQHAGERLAAFKVPAVVELVEDPLPRNAAGKVLKDRLRSMLGGAQIR
jgi:steroid-24-oyl-CoA synthetase